MSETPPRLFGTDGIRAPFGTPPLDRDTVTAVAAALAAALTETTDGAPPTVVLGGDTRESTPEICRWVAAGLAAGGARWRYLGVAPTPAVARLTSELGADAGVAVSASHNPLPDNGVKLLDARGAKWSEEAERELEARIAALGRQVPPDDADGEVRGDDLPALEADEAATERWLDLVAASADGGSPGGPAAAGGEPGDAGAGGDDPPAPLAGLCVALDAANGAASPYARRLFERLGARVQALCDAPDGQNINRGCGSTDPGRLAEAVKAWRCHLGFSFDGDADRAILVDETGAVRDGDAILYLWARALDAAGELPGRKIVATSMSNLGLERALAAHGIGVVRCGVGDREVVETMRAEGVALGGEQSGHVVHLGLSETGDGLLTAVQVARIVRDAGRPVSELLAGFRRFPQVLLNVRVAEKPDLATLPKVAAEKERVESELGREGRLVLRYSGTEPLARVMIEGPDQETIDRQAEDLAAAICAEIGA